MFPYIEVKGATFMPRMMIAIAVAVLFVPRANADGDWQDFEQGQGQWFADNGVWEVGTPTNINVGPLAAGVEPCHQGSQCAATVLNGNYPSADSRLVSPAVQLAQGTALAPLFLRFWHWFSWIGSTRGVVQISVFDETTSQWSDWTNVSNFYKSSSAVWTQAIVDLTAYSGEIARIGFFHENLNPTSASGWYIDEIDIRRVTPCIFSDSFESGYKPARTATQP